MKKSGFLKKIVFLSALTMLVYSMSAFADGVIVAPGVVIPSHTENAGGPGAGPGVVADTPAEAVNQGGDVISQVPGVNETPSTGTSVPGGEQSQPAATDRETLIAQSMANPYTIYPTEDPNVFISRGRAIDKTKPMVALTYDDGPQTDAGNRIIDVFNKYNQRTTFFMVGDRVPSRAAEVKRMAESGHEVANHTYSHTYLNKVGAETIRSQVVKCNDIIEQTTGVRPRVMRLPGGNKNSTVLANVNMPIILWNIDTRDWDHRNVSKILAAVNGKVKDGDIVLMHELYDATASASETMVPDLVNKGFQLVTISEMAEIKGISLNANQIYYSF